MSKSVEETYQMKNDIEHVLLRPDTYIGSINAESKDVWIYENNKMIKKNIEFVPGLYKIFDELLVNAWDHFIREKTCNTIKITINNNTISVFNNGPGIPIQIHKEHNLYIPEMIFGHLRTSSNYDDSQKKITGGRNGFGAKLTNIFSSEFIIETVDNKKKYVQKFKNNMTVIEKPVITKTTAASYVKITFTPELSRFGMKKLDDDIVAILKRRCMDIAGCSDKKLTVTFNDEKFHFDFKHYIHLYYPDNKIIFDDATNRWKVGLTVIPDNGFDQISFVNGIMTIKGGSHVDFVLNKIIKIMKDKLQKKMEDTKKLTHYVKNNIVIFVNSLIENPSFDSQTKDTLTIQAKDFGSKFEFHDKFVKDLNSLGLDKLILELNDFNNKVKINTTTKLKPIAKFDRAEWDTKKTKVKELFVILTEGDSAKTLVMSGRKYIENGNQLIGVYPMKGKLLNVRDVSSKKISENEEIKDILNIFHLSITKQYKDTSNLRYGNLVIFTDQDSVTGDTPILLKDNENNIHIKTIQSISTKWKFIGNKEYGHMRNYSVWTSRGWSPIVHIMRHKTSKRIFRIHTNTGIVDVTEDHSLLNTEHDKIKPKLCKLGDELLHGFMNDYGNGITYDINNTYIKGFYDREFEYKWINNNNMTVEVKDKLMAQHIYLIYRYLHYHVNIDYLHPNKYILNISKQPFQNPENKIIGIYDLGEEEQYVYDFETDNHEFQAGIGQMIVSNTDGSHIKGLIINMIHKFWPSLLEVPFIYTYRTPIVKCFKNSQTLSFYNLTDYEKWKSKNESGWRIKYYKGLGTFKDDDAKELFDDFYKKLICFEKGENVDDCITLAFEKKRADDRKRWLGGYNRSDVLDSNTNKITYGDFIHKELIHFSNYDNERSIPNMIDGLKPSQRKILFSCFKKGVYEEKDEVKVSQLSGYISEHTDYHHGEASLQGAIIGMAQNFVGSNNINLLFPNGGFGSRLKGGDDHASPRYIYTYLSSITPFIFPKDDFDILEYNYEDGHKIEPVYYIPIIPMILVNGTSGIGTGFSTNVCCFNPSTIIDNLLCMLDGKPTKQLHPWYRNFNGKTFLDEKKKKTYEFNGMWNKIDEDTIEITELPIGTWTDSYKIFLTQLQESNVIKSYSFSGDNKKVHFTIKMDDEIMFNMIEDKLIEKTFKLTSTASLNNMNLYDCECKMKKYENVDEIMDEFYDVRLELYVVRKRHKLKQLENEMNILKYRKLFIELKIADKIQIDNKLKADIIKQIENHKIPPLSLSDDKTPSFNYLLDMPLYSLTKEKIDDLNEKYKLKTEEYDNLMKMKVTDIWKNELNKLKEHYNKWIIEEPKNVVTKKRVVKRK